MNNYGLAGGAGPGDDKEPRRHTVALCYDDPKEVPVIKAATQKKRRDGMVAANMIFDVSSR